MIVSTTLVALSALAASVDAAALRRHNFPVPSTYTAAYLEPYDQYHARYLALSCYTKHNTTFFDDCCHPMLKSEKLETARLPKCIPGSSNDDDDDQDCDDADEEPQQSTPPPPPSGPANAADDPADPANHPASSSEDKPAPTSAAPPPPPPPPPPKSTSSEKPKPTSTSKKPAPTGGIGGVLGDLFSAFSLTSDIKSGGIATFFTQNGNAGNCGKVHQDTEHVVALPTSTYANGAHCGKKIAIVDKDSGKSATAIVADSCPTCPDASSLDLSTSLFNLFTTPDKGIFNVAWAFIE